MVTRLSTKLLGGVVGVLNLVLKKTLYVTHKAKLLTLMAMSRETRLWQFDRGRGCPNRISVIEAYTILGVIKKIDEFSALLLVTTTSHISTYSFYPYHNITCLKFLISASGDGSIISAGHKQCNLTPVTRSSRWLLKLFPFLQPSDSPLGPDLFNPHNK